MSVFATGFLLRTRDGRKFGNGIVTDVNDRFVFLETDFGNTAGPLMDSEVLEFWFGPDEVESEVSDVCQSVEKWRRDRDAKRRGEGERIHIRLLRLIYNNPNPTPDEAREIRRRISQQLKEEADA